MLTPTGAIYIISMRQYWQADWFFAQPDTTVSQQSANITTIVALPCFPELLTKHIIVNR